MKPSTGSVTRPPITAPSPSVETSRKTEREHRLVAGLRAGRPRRRRRRARRPRLGLDLRRLREPACRGSAPGPRGSAKTTAIDRADRDDPTSETTKPTRQHDDAHGKADGPEARAGSVRDVRGSVPSRSQQISQAVRLRDRSNRGSNYAEIARRGRGERASEPVLGPAPVDELADLGAHLDLGRPARGRPRRAAWRWRRSRACRRRTGARSRGRDGRRAPR